MEQLSDASQTPSAKPSRFVFRPIWPVLAIVGSIGSLAGMLLIHFCFAPFELPEQFLNMPLNASTELVADYKVAYTKVTVGNSVAAVAGSGALVGLLLGFLVGKRARIVSALAGTLSAGLAAALGAAAGGYVIAGKSFVEGGDMLLYRLDPSMLAMLVQFASWGTIGLALAVALACCRPGIGIGIGIAKAAFWGVVGGLMAAVLHNVVGSIAFPASETMLVVPASLTEKLLWAGGGGLCIGLSLIPLCRKDHETLTSSE